MLAYSSIEHMGLLALGAAAGGALATAAVLLHMLGHGLVKASHVRGGRADPGRRGQHRDRRRPRRCWPAARTWRGPCWPGGRAARLPAVRLFFSEVAIVIAGWQRRARRGRWPRAGLLLVVFAGLARHAAAHDPRRGAARQDRPTPPDRSSHGPRRPAARWPSALAAVARLRRWPARHGCSASAAAVAGGLRR